MRIQEVEYQAGKCTMQGFVARNNSPTPQPIVLVVHDWSGCGENAQTRARHFAGQGYVGFAVDLYGKDKRGSDTDNGINQKLMDEVMKDRKVIVARLQAALDCARKLDNINPNKVMVVGFCFGGLCALDFARSGADVIGVVSVHGLLFKPDVTKRAKITARVLALHGYQDKMVSPENLLEFQDEMSKRKAVWETHVFSDCMHAFTNPKANNPKAGLLYNAHADHLTWEIVAGFAKEIFI